MAAQAAQEWPPKLGDQAVLELASDWALSSGLVLRPPTSSTDAAYTRPGQSVIHAPYALYPSAFPRKLFQQAMDLQAVYNRLYADVTVDDAFLDKVIGGAVSKVDEFQGRLYDIWKQVKKEGICQVRFGCPRMIQMAQSQVSLTGTTPVAQPLALGLFRSDYLVHAPADLPPSEHTIKQVEFNTISASFASLSTRVGELHRCVDRTHSGQTLAVCSSSGIHEH